MNEQRVNDVCRIIANTSPYSFYEVRDVYKQTHSIYTTIFVLDVALMLNLTPIGVLDELRKNRSNF